MSFHAYASYEAKTPLKTFEYEPKPLAIHDVELEITHCGVCHSDIHLTDGDWGGNYPMVPGHEVIGIVKAVGAGVAPTLMGKRVGVGWQSGSCLDCAYCLRGEENLCDHSVATCAWGNYGGFARHIRLDSRFCHVIPDALDSENAAPLLCAGITVYSPLRRMNANAQTRVGVVGIGGLGHLAVQYAREMGCEVTAFTTSPKKAEEAHTLGAHHAIITTEANALKKARQSIDLLIVTVAVKLDWTAYTKTLRKGGTICFVGAVEDTFNVPISLILTNELNVTGGSIGGRAYMREMLQFSADRNIVAYTEKLPFDAVNTAFDRLRKNDVRYRFVLEW